MRQTSKRSARIRPETRAAADIRRPHPAGRIACAAPYNEQCITRTSNPAMKMRCFAVEDSFGSNCELASCAGSSPFIPQFQT